LSWPAGWERVTKHLVAGVVRLCRALPVKQVAEFHGLDWTTVKDLAVRDLTDQLLR